MTILVLNGCIRTSELVLRRNTDITKLTQQGGQPKILIIKVIDSRAQKDIIGEVDFVDIKISDCDIADIITDEIITQLYEAGFNFEKIMDNDIVSNESLSLKAKQTDSEAVLVPSLILLKINNELPDAAFVLGMPMLPQTGNCYYALKMHYDLYSRDGERLYNDAILAVDIEKTRVSPTKEDLEKKVGELISINITKLLMDKDFSKALDDIVR